MKIIRPTAIRDSGGSFTRASSATYYDSVGTLKTAAVNIPRIGYDPTTHAHKGLIYETAATNLLGYSEQLDNGAWVKTIYTVTANAVAAPDGLTTADKLDEATTASANREITNTGISGFTVSTIITASIFVKDAGRGYTWIRLASGNGTFSSCYAVVNLSTGTIINSGTSGGVLISTSISALNSGWFRVTVTGTLANDVTSAQLSVIAYNGSTTTYAGVAGTGVYAWGAQIETGSIATSYITTPAGATVTRAADVAAGTGFLYTNVPEAPVTLLTKPEIFITQSPSVTIQSYVLSFYGTGLLTLSGVYSGTLSGTGTNNRVYLVFTPSSAGTLTITLSSAAGSVIKSQLEVGSVLGPYINEAAWNSGTTYATSQRVSRDTPGTHKIYQSVSGGLSSVPPENAPTLWTEVSSTNRWQAFDESISTSTKYLNSITYLLKPGRINSLAVLGISAADITISLIDPSTGEIVFASSADLNNGVTVGDWYQYFYEPIYQQEALAITNLLDAVQLEIYGYAEAVLAVTFNYPSNIVEVGALVVGLSAELGSTQNAPTVGIIDYSKKEADIFGNVNVIVRNFSKRVSAKVMFKSTLTDNINQILAQYRSTPLVWVGADNLYTSLIVYGFYRDYDITIDNIIMSSCNLTIEGLT